MRPAGAPVVERPHEVLRQRQRQHRVAQQPEAAAGRRHEAGALAGLVDDLARRTHPLGAVVGQQRRPGGAAHHRGQLPAQRLRVLEGGVGPTHAEDRQQVRRIAGKQHPADHVVGQRQRAGRIHRRPVHLPGRAGVADHRQLRVDARAHRVGLQRLLGRLTGWQLVVHPPDAMRLAVHQDGVATVPVGVEEGQPLGGVGQIDADVGNDEQALERRALHLQPQLAADGRAAAVGSHQPVGLQRVGPFGRVDGQQCVVVALVHLHQQVAPAQVDQAGGGAGVEQVLLQELLLDVEHRPEAVVVVVRRLHAEHPLTAVDGIAAAPGQARSHQPVGHAHLLQDLQRAAGEDDGAAAGRHLQLGIQHHTGHAVARQFQRRHQPGRTCAGNHHRVPGLRRVGRRQPRRVHLVAVVERRARRGARLVHGDASVPATPCCR